MGQRLVLCGDARSFQLAARALQVYNKKAETLICDTWSEIDPNNLAAGGRERLAIRATTRDTGHGIHLRGVLRSHPPAHLANQLESLTYHFECTGVGIDLLYYALEDAMIYDKDGVLQRVRLSQEQPLVLYKFIEAQGWLFTSLSEK